jgi:hypothetical protein
MMSFDPRIASAVPHEPVKAEKGDPAHKAGSQLSEKEEAVCETASKPSGSKAEVSSASEKTPSFKEAFTSGLRKGIGRFLEKSGEVLAEHLWPTIGKVCLLKVLGIEFSLESLKVLKELISLF